LREGNLACEYEEEINAITEKFDDKVDTQLVGPLSLVPLHPKPVKI
jgi:hypothetical protein